MLHGIQNFLQLINDNWTTIIVIIGLLVGLFKKIQGYLSKSDEEKIAIAKTQIKETMLKMITTAEQDYEAWNEAGSIKRSQVIKEVYEKYPILSKAINQEEMIAWIDEQINNSLKTLRKIVKQNNTIE